MTGLKSPVNTTPIPADAHPALRAFVEKRRLFETLIFEGREKSQEIRALLDEIERLDDDLQDASNEEGGSGEDCVYLANDLLSVQLDDEHMLPCPFCGGSKMEMTRKYGDHHITCQQCGAEGPGHGFSDAVAAIKWNRRA